MSTRRAATVITRVYLVKKLVRTSPDSVPSDDGTMFHGELEPHLHVAMKEVGYGFFGPGGVYDPRGRTPGDLFY